jgi:hypothetical protein
MIVKMYVEIKFEFVLFLFIQILFILKGFYTIYNKLFKEIAEQDIKASTDKTIEIPDFGNSESDYEEVRNSVDV